MQAGEKVGIFLKQKLQENNLKKSHVAKETGISPYVISSISNNKQKDISLKTVLTLANYFNCSIDEVLSRNSLIDFESKTYCKITSEEAMNKIRNFMMNKFEESNINIAKFSKNCGLENDSIREFIVQNSKHKNIYCNNIITIADHFSISIDALIGRSNNSNNSNNKDKAIPNNEVKTIKTTENPDKPKDILQKLPAKDAIKLEEIKQTYEKFQNEIKHKVNANNRIKSKVKDSLQSR